MPSRLVTRGLAVLALATAISWIGCGGGGSDLTGPAPGSLDVPFTPGWSGSLPDPSGQAIAVSLEAMDGASIRWGVAVGPSPAEAAVRATLDALNRHLAAVRPPD